MIIIRLILAIIICLIIIRLLIEVTAYLKITKRIKEDHKKEEKTLSYKCDKNVEETFETKNLDENS